MAEIENPFDKPKVQQSAAEKVRMLNRLYGATPMGSPYYLKDSDAVEGKKMKKSAVMQMGSYVNPQLAQHSTYFAALDAMMKCVEKNKDLTEPTAQDKACASEFKNLRLAAFQKKLTYHEVNRRWFMGELENKRNFSNY